MKDTIKQSPLPIILALTTPFVVFAAGFYVSKTMNPVEEDPVAAQETTDVYQGTANVIIRLMDSDANPIDNREVTFAHEIDEEDETTEIVRNTDSSGYATISVPRIGNVKISVADAETTHQFNYLEASQSDEFSAVLIVEETKGAP